MTQADKLPGRPLEGIRVIEVGVWHAGPGAAAILGDLGADVIKIESLNGDPDRHGAGTAVLKSAAVDDGNDNWTLLFDMSNRNKRGVCLDVGNVEGREVLHRLVESADVFVTNLKLDTKMKLGLDYATLSAVNPRIIHVNVSGFGPAGPLAAQGGFDRLGQAMSGMMFMTGDEPTPLPVVVLDQLTAINAANAAVTALLVRERTGVGQDVHASLYGSATALLHTQLVAASALQALPDVSWDRTRKSPLLTTFRCKDGRWLMGTHAGLAQWPAFCAAIGQDELAGMALDVGDFAALKDLFAILDPILAQKTADEWLEIFRPAGLMFSAVQTFREVLDDEQALVNNYVVDIDHPVLGDVRMPGFPVAFGKQDAGPRSVSPGLGEHTLEVLREHGYGEPRIQELLDGKVIA